MFIINKINIFFKCFQYNRIIILFFILIASHYSKSQTPFNCDNNIYYVSNFETGDNSSNLITTDQSQFTDFSSNNITELFIDGSSLPAYNAIGYNINDGFIYGILADINGATNVDLDLFDIVKIGSDGIVENLGFPTLDPTDTSGAMLFGQDPMGLHCVLLQG